MHTMMERWKSDIVRLCCFEFFFCAYLAAYYSFIFVFLQYKGFSSTAIGTIFAINAFMTILSQPFWGIVSDKLQNIKKVFILCILPATLLYQILPFCSSPVVTGLLLAVINFFYGTLMPLTDSWILQKVAGREGIGYGHIRLWGSIGFAIASYIMGRLIVQSSVYLIFPAFAILGLVTVGFCLSIKTEKPAGNIPLRDLHVGRLLKNYHYVVFLAFATLFFIPIIGCETFFTQLLKSTGGNEEKLGLAFAVCALIEVPLFFYSSRLLQRFNPVSLILLASFLYILRQWAYLLSTQPGHLILVQVIQGIAYGIFLSSAVNYIDTMSPPELKATSQTLFGSLFYGVTGIGGSYLGGFLVDHIGLLFMFRISFYASIIVLIIYLAVLYLQRRHRQGSQAPVQ